MTIRSRIEIIGVNPYVLVSAEEAMHLKKGSRRPIPVHFQINKSQSSWRVNLMPVGDGSFRLYLNEIIRKASGLKVGDFLSIDIQFDDEYKGGPLHPMPLWFSDSLSRNSKAKNGWKRLAPSRKKEILRYFARLKSSEAKKRNMDRALHVLAGGRGRFMGREWNEDIT